VLRSDRWLVGEDEVALEHRVALRSAGVEASKSGGRPVVAIMSSFSELNPCNLPLRKVVGALRQGVSEAGGLPVEVPVLALGEDLMKPSAMLYRDLLAIEVEEMLRSYPIDGAVLLVGCDKTVPGAMMGAASARLPTLVLPAGARPASYFEGKRLGTGTDLWRMWDKRRAGLLDDGRWAEVEACLAVGTGTCNTMGTASTMAILAEVLGWCMPGVGTIPAGGPSGLSAARRTGHRIVELVRLGLGPAEICSAASVRNALRVLNAIGGSTNAAIHLAALAGRLGIEFRLRDVDTLGRPVPLLVDVEPAGKGLVQDFHESGGVPALLGVLRDSLEGDALLANGQKVRELANNAPEPGPAIAPLAAPLLTGGPLGSLKGLSRPTAPY
jgi:dihydroxyacid dehydratase/phosphogluconate dehydratase